MNNCIISLNNELIKLNKSYLQYNNLNSYLDDLKMLLYFYSKISYNIGINLTRKKIELKYKECLLDNFISSFINDNFKKINIKKLDDIIVLFLKCIIYIYRYAQLIEFKNNNIDRIYIDYDFENSDNIIKILYKNNANIDLIIKNLINIKFDSYIKFNLSKNIDLSILNIIPESIKSDYKFNFVNNIYDIPNFNKFYTDNEIDIIKNKFISLNIKDNVYINKEYYNYNYLLIKYTIKDKIKIDKYWIDKFNKEHNFINYKSLNNAYQYMLENYILYFLDKKTLLKIDKDNYKYIEKCIF